MKDLNLPKTDFPQKADGNLREPQFNKLWNEREVFKRRNEMNDLKEFVLHDGPPYANGSPHMGHYLNKTLKDVVVKYKLMKGHPVHYRPGWDCHGLPTELKVQKMGEYKSTPELRNKCEEYADSQMNVQRDFFTRLGLFGDWDNPYLTMNREYELNQLEAFFKLYKSGVLYRDEKPVHYSPSTQTVLADSELEYYDRQDTSVYFKFPSGEFNLVCWTTMPWTLLSNKGVCVHPDLTYKVVEYQGDKLLVEESCNLFGDNVLETYLGKDLEMRTYVNQLNGEENFVMLDTYVKTDSGTGLVHLNPAHGDHDFEVCKKYGVDPEVLVDKYGNLSNGYFCLDEGSDSVRKEMKSLNMTLKEEVVTHSYPHDWRTKKPVVFNLTKQFFLKLEDKQGMLEAVKPVDFSKNSYKNRFRNMLLNRDAWCVSRQRKWGFPLPVFLKGDETLMNEKTFDYLYKLFEKYGSNVWFDKTSDELLPMEYRGQGWEKSEDTLDVWLDSGFSWYVLGKEPDLYFEGSDQHRGWFQSSFLTSYLLNKKAPYKKVLTHGFVLDEHGKKMAKSEGNVVDPKKYMDMYNSDVLRLWALSVDYKSDVKVGDSSVKTNSNVYFRMRNSFRYLLSNLFDFTEYNPKDLSDKDSFELKELEKFEQKLMLAYESYDFRSLFNLTTNYLAQVSKRYFDLETKELLYEGGTNSKERRNRQWVMDKMLNKWVVLLAPLTPYLCEDVYQTMGKGESVFFEKF